MLHLCFVTFQEYIHRVGRTARGVHGKGHALLFLLPEEVAFLRYLKHAKVVLSFYLQFKLIRTLGKLGRCRR